MAVPPSYDSSVPGPRHEGDTMYESTEEEINTLRHIGDKIPYAAWLVAIVELAERFTCL